MKKLNLKFSVPLVLMVLISTLYACKKNFLSQTPLGVISPSTLANAAGVNGLLIGAYSLLDGVGSNGGGIDGAASNWNFGSVAAGDSYKGSQPSDGGADALPVGIYTFVTSNPYVNARYDILMASVARCNDVLREVPLAKDLSSAQATEITAEARFLRGHYYLELRKQYGWVPYYDETITDANQPNNVEIWPKIEADFQAGIDGMPGTQPQKGRANKWAATAYLAKTYMFEHKYAAALALFHTLISSGTTASGQAYALNPVFQTNFSPQPGQKNSAESVFAAQTSVNDGATSNNGNKGDELGFPYSGNGPGGCCGWNNPSQWLANSFKTDANGLPLLDTANPGDNFNTGGDVSNPLLGAVWAGNVDPRIDITMGRIGKPYLDWGLMDATYIRDPSDGVFSPRKNVYSKAEKGSLSDVSSAWDAVQSVANNVNLMRYADILLMAAECEVLVGSTSAAETDVNMVRARANNPAGWVYMNSAYSVGTSTYAMNETPADKYKVSPYPAGSFADKVYATKAIHMERKLELGMEGMRWYDLQRWDGASVSDPITGSDGSMAKEINAFFAHDSKINSQLVVGGAPAHFTAGRNEYYPIPQQEIDVSASLGKEMLKQNAGY
ncbi:MAG: RagB/SusD family nutrient uptake outer membrane protein [Sphingobacteriales bacterium]